MDTRARVCSLRQNFFTHASISVSAVGEWARKTKMKAIDTRSWQVRAAGPVQSAVAPAEMCTHARAYTYTLSPAQTRSPKFFPEEDGSQHALFVKKRKQFFFSPPPSPFKAPLSPTQSRTLVSSSSPAWPPLGGFFLQLAENEPPPEAALASEVRDAIVCHFFSSRL